MTRHLSELLQAPEPHFRLQLQQLEQTSGHQNLDIKLSVEIMHAAQAKMRHLGLDHQDTSPEELYHILLARVSADDKRLERSLRTRAATHISAEADLMAGMVHALQHEVEHQKVFGLKSVTIKRQLKKQAPKRLQKLLGYRSLDAMLRAEAPAVLATMAYVIESVAWQRNWHDSYKQLKPADFEMQNLKIVSPSGSRWTKVTDKIMSEQAHTILAMPELGALILLPLPADKPVGMVIATLALALHELNTINAVSNYLKASQVHADFGHRLRAVVNGKMSLTAPQFSQALSWQTVQQYFTRAPQAANEDVFGPYVDSADFNWHNVEALLTKICPSLAFWENSSFVSYLQGAEAVSCNILDTAISCCNRLSYQARSFEHAQQALWSELTLRYLDLHSLEAAITTAFQPQLATEVALA